MKKRVRVEKAPEPAVKVSAKPAPRTRQRVLNQAPLKIPAILLEADEPPPPPLRGPGQKYALGPTSPTPQPGPEEEELPEAYGTRKLMLTPRDPHWLYAHWDLTHEQRRRYNALSADRHLVVRVYSGSAAGQPVTEVHVHPESHHWFIHVRGAAMSYVAELGYYRKDRQWISITTSAASRTPSEAASSDRSTEFATMAPPREWGHRIHPPGPPPEKWVRMAEFALEREFLGLALAEIPFAERPEPGPAEWTAAHERALDKVIGLDEEKRRWINSLEIAELIHRQAEQDISSMAAARLERLGQADSSQAISSLPGGQQPAAKGFWFNINAELVVYGATKPDATVTIAGRPIQLRPDGTFSYRFALPDGHYQLPVAATSPENDVRQAELRVGRSTAYQGDVGTHPQDKSLERMTTSK